MTKTGEVVLDWGDGRVQDVLTGEFLQMRDPEFGRPATDADLEVLRKSGRVESFDARTVYLRPLPEPRRPALE
ncbi:MAG: hypothetical protein WD906_02525 [Anaerolineales bacterium]